MKKTILIVAGTVLLIGLVAFFRTDFGQEVLMYILCGIFGLFVIVGGLIGGGETSSQTTSVQKRSNLVSCRKCGYLGVGSNGYCRRCGSTTAYDVKETSQMISCRKCGYLGVGPGNGYCPHCGSTTANDIKKGSIIISCRKCGYLGVSPNGSYCPHCGWNCADRIN